MMWGVVERPNALPKRSSSDALSPLTLGIIELLFSVFLLLVMARITVGEADSAESRLVRAEGVAEGDRVKQVLYILAFASFLYAWVRLRGLRLPSSLSLAQIMLIGWIISSTLWSSDPGLTFRRSILLVVAAGSISMAMDLLGPYRSVRALYVVLAICFVASLVAIPFFPFAVHPPTEIDQSIVGGWRGVFVHKNTAGGVCAMAFLIFLHFSVSRGRWHDYLFMIVCFIFLIGSKSKTPLILLTIVVPLGFIYRYFAAHARSTVFLVLGLAGCVIATVLIAWTFSAKIDDIFTDPTALSSRVEIWTSAYNYAMAHFWFGSGYGALWATTTTTAPIFPYLTADYQEFIVHSHNGYLELFASAGFPALALAIGVSIIIPARQFIGRINRGNPQFDAMLFSIWVFGILENFLETQLYTRDREIWVVFFVAILAKGLQARPQVPSPARLS